MGRGVVLMATTATRASTTLPSTLKLLDKPLCVRSALRVSPIRSLVGRRLGHQKNSVKLLSGNSALSSCVSNPTMQPRVDFVTLQ